MITSFKLLVAESLNWSPESQCCYQQSRSSQYFQNYTFFMVPYCSCEISYFGIFISKFEKFTLCNNHLVYHHKLFIDKMTAYNLHHRVRIGLNVIKRNYVLMNLTKLVYILVLSCATVKLKQRKFLR